MPQSILVNEMLPRLRRDPGYLDRAGYEVVDARGKRIPSSSVNWGAYGAKVPYGVRQTPSEANALGELKILFPNKHAIYMHDTPQKKLFQRDMRALQPWLRSPAGSARHGGRRARHVGRLYRGEAEARTCDRKGARRIPVYVAYFTAWPDMSGKVEYFSDVYDRDTRLQQALDSTQAVRSPAS